MLRPAFLTLAVVTLVIVVWGILRYDFSLPKSHSSLRLAIVTDIDHCPSRVPVNTEHFERFLRELTLGGFDAVVNLGDNASHRLGNCSETGDQDARWVADQIRMAGLPSYFVLGDHDITSNNASYEAWLETSGRRETYYSFDLDGVHIVILDTVLGGESFSPECHEIAECHALEERAEVLRQARHQRILTFAEETERKHLQVSLKEWDTRIDLTRSAGKRDRGRIGEAQLMWLRQDLAATPLKKVLVISDHPLFHFVSDRKEYNIINGAKTREILEASDKTIVAISGEAHLWHETEVNGVRYYIVDEFHKANGSWATFAWDDAGYRFEKVTHE